MQDFHRVTTSRGLLRAAATRLALQNHVLALSAGSAKWHSKRHVWQGAGSRAEAFDGVVVGHTGGLRRGNRHDTRRLHERITIGYAKCPKDLIAFMQALELGNRPSRALWAKTSTARLFQREFAEMNTSFRSDTKTRGEDSTCVAKRNIHFSWDAGDGDACIISRSTTLPAPILSPHRYGCCPATSRWRRGHIAPYFWDAGPRSSPVPPNVTPWKKETSSST